MEEQAAAAEYQNDRLKPKGKSGKYNHLKRVK